VEDGGKVGYGGFGHFGMMVFNFRHHEAEALRKVRWTTKPWEHPVSHVLSVISDNTPRLQGLVIGVPETVLPDCREPYKPAQVIDVRILATPHHPGCFLARSRRRTLHGFCFAGAGLPQHLSMGGARHVAAGVRGELLQRRPPRLRHLRSTQPKEVAWFVGAEVVVDNYRSKLTAGGASSWNDQLLWVATHRHHACRRRHWANPCRAPEIQKWTVAHCNLGWDDQTPQAVLAGRLANWCRQE
jgi:hypothetical protein